MVTCITCGRELHPERAATYDYCTAADCQDKNATGLTMVAVGVNKSAEQFQVLDERTREEIANGKFRDQRRASFGPATAVHAGPEHAGPEPGADGVSARTGATPARSGTGPSRTGTRRTAGTRPVRRSWSRAQVNLAMLYNEQGVRPDEIARRLGLSRWAVTQIILAGRRRGR